MFGAVLGEISLDREWVGEELCGAVHWGGFGRLGLGVACHHIVFR